MHQGQEIGIKILESQFIKDLEKLCTDYLQNTLKEKEIISIQYSTMKEHDVTVLSKKVDVFFQY